MAAINRPNPSERSTMYAGDTKDQACTFCGRTHPVAMWAGQTTDVYVCRPCATDKLPRLMADAVWFKNTPSHRYLDDWKFCERQFLLALLVNENEHK